MFIDSLLGKSKLKNVALLVRHAGMWAMSQATAYENPNFKAPKAYPEYAKGIAVYCVHGTADQPSSFSLVAERILHRLPDVVSKIYLVKFAQRLKGVSNEAYAEQLAEQIIANGDKNVILMGHSRGSIVAAYLAEFLAKKANIKVVAVFAIGGPFEGSTSAVWPLTAMSTSINEMKLNSEFLDKLSQKINDSQAKYFYFAASRDPLVTANSAFRGQNEYHSVLYDQGDDVCIIDPAHPSDARQVFPSMVLLDFHDHVSIMSSHRMINYMEKYINMVVDGLMPGKMKKFEAMELSDAGDDIPMETFDSVEMSRP